ncbi:MAG TPA: zinc finger domain-containing protein [Burkholderiales bacterium]
MHPDLRPTDLPLAQARTLGSRILTISRRAYRTGGVTNDARLAARLRKEGATYAQYRHAVHERAGLPCYVCGTSIVRIERSRAVFLCPHCQALPAAWRPALFRQADFRLASLVSCAGNRGRYPHGDEPCTASSSPGPNPAFTPNSPRSTNPPCPKATSR